MMRAVLLAGGAIAGSVAHAEPRTELAVLHAFPGIDIVESRNHVIYSHGGPAPKLDHVDLVVEVRDARAHTLSVRSIGIVSTCDPKPGEIRALKLKGHELRTWDTDKVVAKGTASIATPAGKPDRHRARIRFKDITTTVGCAFALDVVVDRIRKKIELPLTLEREFDAE
jgi:hypothetical protein